MNKKTTHFGYREVSPSEKSKLVENVFSSVAGHYDLMNDLMSWGIHRLWKTIATAACGLGRGMRVLDVAGGTGDMAIRMRPILGKEGQLVLTDINQSMLVKGQNRMHDEGYVGSHYVRCDAEHLPFKNDYFDCAVIAFGLRNITQKQTALESILAVLKPAGRLVILEFSKPHSYLGRLYDWYSFNIIPKLGRYVAKDESSYRYLVESIRMHPDQCALRDMITAAGFERCEFFNLSGGIVAIHRAYKP